MKLMASQKKQSNAPKSSQSVKMNPDNDEIDIQYLLVQDMNQVMLQRGEDSSGSSIGTKSNKKLYFGEDEPPKTESEFLRFFFKS
jgi:hypothetical protein